MATQDGSGLQPENVRRTFHVLRFYPAKITRELIKVYTPSENSLDISILEFQEHVSERRHLIIILATF